MFRVWKIIIKNFRELNFNVLNLTDGGEGTCGYGHKHTYETRKRLSESHKNRIKSKEHLEKIAKKNRERALIMRGENHPHSHTIEYYETNSVVKSSFKRTCKTRGLDFNDFDEYFDKFHIYPDGKRVKKFFFIKKK